jgi:RNA recognition motif-containing protein
VKSVFVDGMPPSWDEEKVKEHFWVYGTIERIVLARNMLSAKRKDFGFVNYIDRDAALLCIEAVNNTEISDGDIKVKQNSQIIHFYFYLLFNCTYKNLTFIILLIFCLLTDESESDVGKAAIKKQTY